jgi:hypothetical protein
VRLRNCSWLVVVWLAVVPGCSCGGDSETLPQATTASAGGMGGGGAGGNGGSGGEAGAGGQGGGGAPPSGQTQSDFVNAGTVSTSPSWRLVSTLGQSTQNQGTTSSRGYRIRGGLVGSTED